MNIFEHTYKHHKVTLQRGWGGWSITVYDSNGHTLPMSLQWTYNERGDFVKDLRNWRQNAERSIDMRLEALTDMNLSKNSGATRAGKDASEWQRKITI